MEEQRGYFFTKYPLCSYSKINNDGMITRQVRKVDRMREQKRVSLLPVY